MALKEIEEEQQVQIKTLSLGPLASANINQLVSDTLHCPEEKARPLTYLVEEKTRGNPFFVKQFVQTLYQDRLLRFDAKSLSWKWDMAAIKERRVTDNVVDLMVGRLKSLPEETQKVLQLVSCMGNRFDLSTLSMINEQKKTVTLNQLWKAIEEGYVLPQDESYKLISTLEEKELELESMFEFTHDRVQQASYALIPEDDREAIHLKVGRLLLANTAFLFTTRGIRTLWNPEIYCGRRIYLV